MQYLVAVSKMTEWALRFQGKLFSNTVIQVCDPASNAEEAEVQGFYEDLQNLLKLTPKKDVIFIIGNWKVKVGSQEIPGVTGKFGFGIQNDTEQKLTEICQKNSGESKYLLSTTQEMTLHMHIIRWSILNSDRLFYLQPKMEKLYIVSKNKTRSWLWLRSWTLSCQIQI